MPDGRAAGIVNRHPDCGAAFVWVGRALGPRTGWIVAWTIVAANFLALANLAKVVGIYAFLLIGADTLAASTFATLVVGLLALGAVTVVALRGLESSSRLQVLLLGACLAILLVFAAVALAKVYGGTAGPQAVTPSLGWFNPFSGEASGSIAVGLLLTVFLYWGWDVPSAVVEEAEGGSRTSGRAMMVSAITLLGLYADRRGRIAGLRRCWQRRHRTGQRGDRRRRARCGRRRRGRPAPWAP